MKRSALLFVSVAILASCIAFRSWQPFRSWQHRGAAERLLSVIPLSRVTHQAIRNVAAPFSQVTSSPTGRADVDFTVDVGCVLIAQFCFLPDKSDVSFHQRVDAVHLQGAEVEVGCRHSFAGTLCGLPSAVCIADRCINCSDRGDDPTSPRTIESDGTVGGSGR